MVSRQVEGSTITLHTAKSSTESPSSVSSVITRGVPSKCTVEAVSDHVGPVRINNVKLTTPLPIIQSISGPALATGVAETARTATVRVKRAVRSFIVDSHWWSGGTERLGSALGAGP